MQDDELRKRAEEWNNATAARWHDRHDQQGHDLFRAAIDFGLEAIRTAALINGGAVVACFAFLGVLLGSSNPQLAALFKLLLWPAFVFTIGALLAGSASGWSYFSQGYFAEGHGWVTYSHDREENYLINRPEREPLDAKGRRYRRLAVVCVSLSYACVIIGVVWGGMILRP